VELADTASWQQRAAHDQIWGVDNRISPAGRSATAIADRLLHLSTLFTNLSGVTGTGNALASFLLGQVQQFSIDIQQTVLQPRAWFQEWFVQDDWKLTSRLTMNTGTRYTLNFPSTEANDRGAVFNLQTAGTAVSGAGRIFPIPRAQLHWKDFGPRLGISYLPHQKDRTALRIWTGVFRPGRHYHAVHDSAVFRSCRPPLRRRSTTRRRAFCAGKWASGSAGRPHARCRLGSRRVFRGSRVKLGLRAAVEFDVAAGTDAFAFF
jgi:hypothetical protein